MRLDGVRDDDDDDVRFHKTVKKTATTHSRNRCVSAAVSSLLSVGLGSCFLTAKKEKNQSHESDNFFYCSG